MAFSNNPNLRAGGFGQPAPTLPIGTAEEVRQDRTCLLEVEAPSRTGEVQRRSREASQRLVRLIDIGAPIYVSDQQGRNPLHLAALCDDYVVAKKLIDVGMAIDGQDALGFTALMHAAQEDKDEGLGEYGEFNVEGIEAKDSVKILLDAGASLNIKNKAGNTALHVGAMLADVNFCSMLVEKGADPTIKNAKGKTFLDIFPMQGVPGPDRCLMDDDSWRMSLKKLVAEQARDKLIATQGLVANFAKSLLFSDKFSDVVFVAGGERIHAHRCIVAACSEPLSALLQGQWAETTGSSGVAEIKMDQSAQAVRALLRFMYTGEVDEAALDADCLGVMCLADQHDQTELTRLCEQHSICFVQSADSLTFADVGMILGTAKQLSLPSLSNALEHKAIKMLSCCSPNAVQASAATCLRLAEEFGLARLRGACRYAQ